MNNPLFDKDFEEAHAKSIGEKIFAFHKARADFFLALYDLHESGYTKAADILEDITPSYRDAANILRTKTSEKESS